MKVDYHIHTLCSDGVYTVNEIIQKVIENNIASFSITDHDSVSGIKLAKKLSENKLDFITGLEITCSETIIDTLTNPISIHLLGYGFDEDCPYLINILKSRNELNHKVFNNLSKELYLKNHPINISDVPI
ncbi:MAG: PHP domain-containing protein, partial [Peptostreptococcaceae bacterium]